MNTFLLIFLFFPAIYGLPIQDNCESSDAAFYGCLQLRLSDLGYRSDDDTIIHLERQREIFIHCGAKYSECYLQKKLMTMVDKTIQGFEELESSKNEAGSPGYEACAHAVQQKYEKVCNKRNYDENGFKFDFLGEKARVLNCLAEYSPKIEVCSPANIRFQQKLAQIIETYVLSISLGRFEDFLKMNQAAERNLQKPEVSTEECKQSKNKIHDCLKNYKTELSRSNATDYVAQREVFIICGAQNSECYLQKSLMTWVDTMVSTINDPAEDVIRPTEYRKCYDDIHKMYGLECNRDSFDEYGFDKPHVTLRMIKAQCIAEHAQEFDFCSNTTVTALFEQARFEKVRVFKSNLEGFVDYVADGYRYIDED